MSSRRAPRTALTLTALVAIGGLTGCSSLYQPNARSQAFDPYAPVASGAGDSLGGALFRHQVQTANAVRFQTNPAFAAEMNSR